VESASRDDVLEVTPKGPIIKEFNDGLNATTRQKVVSRTTQAPSGHIKLGEWHMVRKLTAMAKVNQLEINCVRPTGSSLAEGVFLHPR
jgi:hypothetical protein